MTAEVGVMNRLGIALAADSAITLGGQSSKIYTSAEKLFMLSEFAPVGAMVYGRANFLDVPWETIIKLYRTRLGRKTFSTLNDYVESFASFIREDKILFPSSSQIESIDTIAGSLFTYLLDFKLRNQLETELSNRSINEDELKIVISDLVSDEIDQLKKLDRIDGVSVDLIKKIKKDYKTTINSVKDKLFGSLPITTKTKNQLSQLIIEALTRKYISPIDAGLVIAGFGEDEHLPSLVEMGVRGIVSDHFLYLKNLCLKIDTDASAVIVPFAKKEMDYTFMDSIDP